MFNLFLYSCFDIYVAFSGGGLYVETCMGVCWVTGVVEVDVGFECSRTGASD